MTEKRKKCTEIKREAIIAAAKSAFQEFGVEAISMNKIAQLAKVSKRTVYNHFESKEELIMFLLSDLWSSAMVQIDIPYDSNLPLEAQLYDLLMADVNAVSSPSFIGLARVALGHFLFKPDILISEQERLANHSTPLLEWLEEASNDRKLMITDLHYTYKQIHNMLNGTCFWPQLAQYAPILDDYQKHQLVDDTVKMFLSLYAVASDSK